MERMDKVLNYKVTDTDVIFTYKKDGEKYKVTTPLYLKDGSENPQAIGYLAYIDYDQYKQNHKVKTLTHISTVIGGALLGVFLFGNYKLVTDNFYYHQYHDTADICLPVVGMLGLNTTIWSVCAGKKIDDEIEEYEKMRSRK